MSSASSYLETAVLNYFFRKQPIPQPAKLYIALYLSDPTDEDIGLEVDKSSYKRQLINFGDPVKANGRSIIKNSEKIEFPVALHDWGIVTHFGIRTKETEGDLLSSAPLKASKDIQQSDQLIFDTGAVSVSLE